MSILSNYYDEYKGYVANIPTFHDDEGNVIPPIDVSIEDLVNKGYRDQDVYGNVEALLSYAATLARFQIISDMLAEKESN